MKYDISSVDLLIAEGRPMKSDYSILKYVEQNQMMLITRDGQNRVGCEENGIPCISFGENPSIEVVIEKIKEIDSNT